VLALPTVYLVAHSPQPHQGQQRGAVGLLVVNAVTRLALVEVFAS